MSLKKDIVWRVGLIYALFFILGMSVIGKIIYIQLVEGDKWAARAQTQTLRDFTILPERGNIYDSEYNLLATSIPIYEIRMDLVSNAMSNQVFEDNIDALSRSLSRLFGDKSGAEYKNELIKARRKGERYHLIKRNVSYAQLSQLKTFPIFRNGRYKGGFIYEQDNKRVLPHKELAARIIGYTTKGNSGNVVGIEGAYENNLKGVIGMRMMQRLSGNVWMPLNDKNEIDPKDGQDIITTIDINIQDVAHHALLKQLKRHNAHHGTAVLMEVKTGEIRAIANLQIGNDGSYHESYNYAIGESTEPGSTFKLPALMVALEDGLIELEDSVETGSGQVRFYDKIIKDTHEGGYGTITVEEVFMFSSNVGVSMLIQQNYHGKEKEFINRLYNMGLNQKLGIEIKGEGVPEIKYPGDPLWSGISLPMMSHGYEVRMTPIQILTFYNAVANDGKMVSPKFVKEIQYHGKLIKKIETEVINPSIASAVTIEDAKRMLEGVVEKGTAKNLNNDLYKIAGKTGTAQIAYQNMGYKGKIQYQASFVGYFPADKPKYSCIVVVNAPSNSVYYGNLVAGPVFKEIADKVYASRIELQGEDDFEEVSGFAVPYSKNGKLSDLNQVLGQLDYETNIMGAGGEWVITTSTDSAIIVKNLTVRDNMVPNVVEMGLKDAVFLLESAGLKVMVKGWGKVRSQSIVPGSIFVPGQQINLEMSFV